MASVNNNFVLKFCILCANYFKAFGQPLNQADESQARDSDNGKSDDEGDEASRYVSNESNDSHQDCLNCLACAAKILLYSIICIAVCTPSCTWHINLF